jgi:stage IV sporulation protein B
VKKIKRLTIIFIVLILFASSYNFVYADDNVYYYAGGFPLGFDLSCEGALIVGLSEVICEDDIYLPAREAGLKSGDYIISLNGKTITTVSDIDEVMKAYKGGAVVAEIISDGAKLIKNIYPKKDLSGEYKLGILIRDYLSGIGTVTIINKNGKFASLGHPVVDDEGKLLGVGGGFSYKCKIIGVVKGERGMAGELTGTILRSEKLGSIIKNSAVGLIGEFNDEFYKIEQFQIGEAKPGNAEIITTINGFLPIKYSISIVKVENDKENRDMVIKITDNKLIKYAGGIVQGMSGSPIIQNGKIVGAITHVFLNDPTRGYAIKIEKMINELNKA